MTAFDIFAALGEISEETLYEAPKPKSRRRLWLAPIATSAACLALCIGAVCFIKREEPYSVPDIPETNTVYTPQSTALETGSPNISETPEMIYLSEPLPSDTEAVENIYESEPLPSETQTPEETTIGPTETKASSENITQSPEETEYPETAIVPDWEEMTDLERYIYLSFNGSEYSVTTEHFDKSELSFLCSGEIYGIFDELSVEDSEELQKKTVPCGFYKINGVSPEYMIAVPTSDGKYTGYENHSFCGENMGDYLEKTNFLARYPLTKLYSGEKCDGMDYYEYELPDLQTEVSRILLSDKSVRAEINPPSDLGRIIYVIYSGDRNVFYVYEGGYVRIGQKFFPTGKDKCGEFALYAKENGSPVLVEYPRSDNTETIPE